jgi:fructose-1,6-bisphosphatase/inositol monophosphatase family enzyme
MSVDDKLIAFAGRLADASGAVIRPFFRQRIEVAHKPGVHAFDPVTEADKGAERAIRAIIDRERPQDAILGEEFGEKPAGLSADKWRWVLDPVDGTRAFITGRHEWGSLIALEHDGVPVLGILDQPVLGERFLGVNGRSVLLEGEKRTPLKVRECAELKDAILCATDPFSYFSAQQADCAHDALQRRLLSVRGPDPGLCGPRHRGRLQAMGRRGADSPGGRRGRNHHVLGRRRLPRRQNHSRLRRQAHPRSCHKAAEKLI